MKKLIVKEKYLKILVDIFRSYCPNAEIWAYGSRLKGNCHDASDLDLTVKTFNDNNCNINALKGIIDDSDIPFLVDIVGFDDLTDVMKNEILKDYVVIFP